MKRKCQRPNELKRNARFFAAWGQLLMLMREEISTYEENEAVECLEDMITQVHSFFVIELLNAQK